MRLVMAGLMLDIKNLFLEFKAPKLNPIKAERGIQGVKILNWQDAIDLASALKFGATKFIRKTELKYTIIPRIKNNKVSLRLTFVRTRPPSLFLSGVSTDTTALCSGPLIPPIIISKKPGIMQA